MTLAWPVSRVRGEFCDFFVKKYQHTFVPSSPVVPHQDPTLLFINAGMNQFKNIFLGTADPGTEFGRLRRAANSQLCIRAGGKHNDLDDVGKDTYHHTFFEMLGSWSFGDYFKREAIVWAWELLTEVYGLPKDRLYVTYFEGDAAAGVPADEEARRIWCELVPPERVLKGNAKDNFWEMGDTGPCGPCSEIHFDRIGGRDAALLVNKDDPMVIEIWNLVFIQFERLKDRSLKPLPQRHVDTGMGLERIASILQNVTSNYDTDTWQRIFAEIQKVTNFPQAYDCNKDKDDITVAYRVVADHIRCLTVALADGAVPDSVGRGFVLRRIIRRAIRYGAQFLNAETGFFSKLVDVVVETLGGFFQHLQNPKTIARVKAILLDEEESFAKTWKVGLKHFEGAKAAALKDSSTVISGDDVFVLHDRYGFPIDLTILLAEKEGMTVDVQQFHAAMKVNQVGGSRVAVNKTFLDAHLIDRLRTDGVPPTADHVKYQWEEAKGKVLAILKKETDTFVDRVDAHVKGEEAVGVILDLTNFYAESGGQIYDTGLIETDDGVFYVNRVLSFGGYVVHIGHLSCGFLSVGENVRLRVNYERRLPIGVNHTTTHQLNWCLRRALEDEKPEHFAEVHQKGSLVTEDMLRFDFSYNAKLTAEELVRVESLLNEAIKKQLRVHSKVVPLQEATKINGLRQMFGEKYPDPVSVVSIGAPVEDLLANPTNPEWRNFSIEFCGGTHIQSLGQVDRAVILSEDALMKGVRRMVVVTRQAALEAIVLGEHLTNEFQRIVTDPEISESTVKSLSVLNKKVGDSSMPLIKKIQLRESIDASIKKLNQDIKALIASKKSEAAEVGAHLAAKHDRSEPFATHVVDQFGTERELLQAVIDAFTEAINDVGLLLIGVEPSKDKALAIATLPPSMVAKHLSAVDWAKSVGKGGGKPNAAQSGIAASDVPTALKNAQNFAVEMKLKLQQ
jgi:alanyl-tRNA synthetase